MPEMAARQGRKVFVIVNPVSGGWRPANTLGAVTAAFQQSGLDHEIVETKKSGDATRIAALVDDRVFDTVVAAGGDGTINEVVNGIRGRRLKLGVIPVGTINVLARELNIPLQVPAAVAVIKAGRVRAIDLGKADDRIFILMAGIGFDAYTIYKTDLKIKKYFRGLAYIFAAAHALLHHPSKRITLEINGHRRKRTGFFLLVSNSSLYGGRFPIVPGAKIDDGLFDVLLFKEKKSESLFRYFGEMLLMKHPSSSYVSSFRTSRLRVTSSRNVLVHTDAELAGSLPMEFSMLPRALKVIVK
jgi:YegS/Rv2252/BmrU family lipid kinase